MASPRSGGSDNQPVWYQRIRDPAIGNTSAVLAVLVAIAAGIGLLREGIFWLIASYLVLVLSLTVLVVISRHRTQKLLVLDEQLRTQGLEAERLSAQLASAEAELACAREEHQAAEGGYASLRDAVIRAARSRRPDIEDFDEELGSALLVLTHERAAAD